MLCYGLELLESGVSALCLADAHMWVFLSMWLLLRPCSEKTMAVPLSRVLRSPGERFQLLAAIAPHPAPLPRPLVLGSFAPAGQHSLMTVQAQLPSMISAERAACPTAALGPLSILINSSRPSLSFRIFQRTFRR